MVKTSIPGVFKRGSRYVVTYRVQGKLRKESVGTLAEARQVKAERTRQIHTGEYTEQSRVTFRAFAMEWVERYQGRGGRHGFRESTRANYRAALNGWVFESITDGKKTGYFTDRLKLAQVSPMHIAQFVSWLTEQKGARGTPLSDSSIRNIVNPLRAMFATAVREGLIRSNPTQQVALPYRPKIEDDDEDEIKALTREQLRTFLAIVDRRHALMMRLLAGTGLRVGEVLALQWRHLKLDGSRPVVRVRRTASQRGGFNPPKSRHGRRDVPIDHALVIDLRKWARETEWSGSTDLVFPSRNGTVLQYSNLVRRILNPAMEEAGASFATFHTLRHTFASLHLARGTNIVQLSRLLGHHSASFTLDVYTHLIDGDVGVALSIDLEVSASTDETTTVDAVLAAA